MLNRAIRIMNKVLLYVIILFTLCFSGCQKDFELASADLQKLGNAAHDLLSGEKYTALKVEIAYTPGFAPDAPGIQHLYSFLNTYLNKPAGIQIIQTPVKNSGLSGLTITDLVRLEKQNRSVFTQGSTITVYILLTDAPFIDERVLATSYWNTSFAIFGPAVQKSTGALRQEFRSRLVSVLLQHEFGHLLGLVGQGSPMQTDHRDENNGAHCNNPLCLMYYGFETVDHISGSSPIPKLDAHCLADLKANGGK